MKNNSFLDVKVGDRVFCYDECSRDFEQHTLLITSIEEDKEFITKTNPTGIVLYGEDLDYDSEEPDDYITVINEATFLGIKDKQELIDKIIKLSINGDSTVKIIDDSDDYDDGCSGVRVRIGKYSFYCFSDEDGNEFDNIESLLNYVEKDIDDAIYDFDDYLISDIAEAIWNFESSGISKTEALYYEAIIDEQIALLDKTVETDDIELD